MRTLEIKENQDGLIESLGEKSDISDINVQKTNNTPNLRIIPAGRAHHLLNRVTCQLKKCIRQLRVCQPIPLIEW